MLCFAAFLCARVSIGAAVQMQPGMTTWLALRVLGLLNPAARALSRGV